MSKTENSSTEATPRDSPSTAPGIVEITNGRWIDVLNPSPEDIHVEDIALSLSRAGRFGGFTSEFYSVASHTSLCIRLAGLMEASGDQMKAVALHDFHEAYLGDIPTPIKKVMTGWQEIVRNLDAAIGERFGVDPDGFESDFTNQVDHLALSIEASYLMHMKTPGFREILKTAAEIRKLTGHSPSPTPEAPEEAERRLLSDLDLVGISNPHRVTR